jgi:signal transduction histidine kinase
MDETARITEKIREGDPLTSKPGSIDTRDAAWEQVCRSRAPLVIQGVAESPLVGGDARLWASYHGLETLLVVPLLWGNEVIGVVSIFNRERRVYRPGEIEMAQALVHLATLALQLHRMAQERQESALVEERNRMAREIHDTLAQGFTAIIFQLEAALEVAEEDRRGAAVHIERALTQSRESLAEARRSVRELRPQPLEGGDLIRSLRELVEKNTGSGPRLELSVRGASYSFSPEVEANLLKIAQEAVTNALKHAQARTVQVDLTYGEWETTITVRDDGRGFALAPNGSTGGYGLSLMRERADFLQGRFEVLSQPGNGTRVSVTVGVPPPGA